ncbi:riboflavin aldehyde-forming enzyme [Microdochium trichocladiopsis]|uniref:Riboflavin aldehyde-forming enzyme n=2 Tax=Microdochium TaxID=67608 RepID=A0A9P9BPT9_9PEZI|nr:riboflavin aldehyde-forming enzyme [Microdochium trichocladiopsis]KAH7029619.1 riboflavin aldehyde-forming enzyme [Microdochium trichocladiopsis]KXJ85094.1 riboflavin aldehyde-forming enzyme [Microdochium bolleyi]
MVAITNILLPVLTVFATAATAATYNGEATWYNPGLGACGKTHGANDLVAAVSAQLFTSSNPNNDPVCGKKAKITRGNKSVTVTVVDKCPECPKANIDLSPAAFKKLGTLAEGRIKVKWVL